MKRKTHGGARRGAGRKPIGTKPFMVWLKPETHGHLKALAKLEKSTVGRIIEAMIENR